MSLPEGELPSVLNSPKYSVGVLQRYNFTHIHFFIINTDHTLGRGAPKHANWSRNKPCHATACKNAFLFSNTFQTGYKSTCLWYSTQEAETGWPQWVWDQPGYTVSSKIAWANSMRLCLKKIIIIKVKKRKKPFSAITSTRSSKHRKRSEPMKVTLLYI